jgi:hypothetical protein
MFEPGHKLSAHNAAIGFDIEPHIKNIFGFGNGVWDGGQVHDGIIMKPLNEPDYPPENISIHYEAMNIDENLLAAIRSDPGVQQVSTSPHYEKEKDVN